MSVRLLHNHHYSCVIIITNNGLVYFTYTIHENVLQQVYITNHHKLLYTKLSSMRTAALFHWFILIISSNPVLRKAGILLDQSINAWFQRIIFHGRSVLQIRCKLYNSVCKNEFRYRRRSETLFNRLH